MSKRWAQERKKDHYYKMAKRDNYRSRAAYKLSQINRRFEIFKPGDTVIDLGANPGGWSQMALELVGETGMIIALDLKPVEPIPGVTIIKGDVRSKIVKRKVRDLIPKKGVNIILSDMSPNISGNYSMDHAKSIELAEMALEYADEFLNNGGHMIVKVFDGDLAFDYFKQIKDKFKISKRHSPKASRQSSSEVYMIGKSKKKIIQEKVIPPTIPQIEIRS